MALLNYLLHGGEIPVCGWVLVLFLLKRFAKSTAGVGCVLLLQVAALGRGSSLSRSSLPWNPSEHTMGKTFLWDVIVWDIPCSLRRNFSRLLCDAVELPHDFLWSVEKFLFLFHRWDLGMDCASSQPDASALLCLSLHCNRQDRIWPKMFCARTDPHCGARDADQLLA